MTKLTKLKIYFNIINQYNVLLKIRKGKKMKRKIIKIGIIGFGNVGKGVLRAIEKNQDMELIAIFTRRPGVVYDEVKGGIFVFETEQAFSDSGFRVDVAILCGGSKEDLPVQGPRFAQRFNTVDSFDTHADIPSYFNTMNASSKGADKVSIVSAGWDPGIFSAERVLGLAFLPFNKRYTFWGKGVSQGHSDAARKVEGVEDARQYTLPIEDALTTVRSGETPDFIKRQMHRRLVYVVSKDGADLDKIKKDIVSIPNYFDEYETEVIFIKKEEMAEKHSKYFHGGFVLASGATGDGNKQILEYRCQLESNPEFTGSVLVACARAAFRLNKEKRQGAFTMLDIPPCYLSPHSSDFLRENFM